MQSCLFTVCRLSPNERRTRMAIATATPTAIRKCHRVVLFNEDLENTCHGLDDKPNRVHLFGQFDGFYNTNIEKHNLTKLQLLQFLKLAKNKYKLKDYDAMELLSFYKSNLTEACRHLSSNNNGNNGRTNMFLDLDIPWRLQGKTIRESPGIKQMSAHKFFTNSKHIFVLDPSYSINVLPHQPMAEQFAGRDIRIQRTYHGDNLLQVGCVLANQHKPFEVASLLLHAKDKRQLHNCAKVVDQLETYMAPLVMATKSWSSDERNNHSSMFQVFPQAKPTKSLFIKTEEVILDDPESIAPFYI